MEEAYRKKKQKFAPILSALQHYIRAGRSIEIIPWVMGIRGLADTKHLHVAVAFLDIPKPKWKDILVLIFEHSVLASVRALVYMHKIQYSSASHQSTMEAVNLLASTQETAGRDDDLRLNAWKRLDNDGATTDNIRRRYRCKLTPSILPSHLKSRKSWREKRQGVGANTTGESSSREYLQIGT
jgi:hypothetical protein